MTRTIVVLPLLAVALGGCGGAETGAGRTADPPSEGVATDSLFLSADDPASETVLAEGFLDVRIMQIMAGGVERPVAPGAIMRAGDRFYLRLTTREDAHVYVMYVGPDRQAHLLLPQDSEELLTPAGTTTRVPSGTRAITLDHEVGLEQLYVVASRRPLSELGDDTLAAVDAARSGERPPAVEMRAQQPEPSTLPVDGTADTSTAQQRRLAGASIRTRGFSVVDEIPGSATAGGSRVVAAADEQGVAVVLFPIDHR